MVPQTALGLLDTLTERIAPLDTRTPAESATSRPEPEPEPVEVPTTPVVAPDPEPPLVDETREEQLAEDRKARERKATRSNKSVSSMAQDLAVAEAVADAHEQRAREDELDAKDFGPASS